MEKEIKILVLQNQEVKNDIGGLSIGVTLEPWMCTYSTQTTFRIHSDKILTIVNPKPSILSKYEELTK
mgnify:CR=1 FL=1